jgi:prolyl 4-hydroxylase
MLDVGRSDLPGMSHSIRWEIVRHVKSVLEAWTHQSLVLTSLYGIRTYKEGAILAPHVDRLPLVSSAISKYFTVSIKLGL